MNKRIHPIWPTILVAIGLFSLLLGQRSFSGGTTGYALSAFGAFAVVFAAIARAIGIQNEPDVAKKGVRCRLFFTTLGGVAAIAIYGALEYVLTPDGQPNLRVALTGLWPVILFCSMATLFAIEWAVLPTARASQYELRRVRASFERGLSASFLIASAFCVCFIATRNERKVDVTLGKRTEASESTRELVASLTEPLKVTLFYPQTSEVADRLTTYFDSLGNANGLLTVERVDQALAGSVASDLGVNENGVIAVSREKVNEKIKLSADEGAAKAGLRNLDSSFAKALVKVTREKATVYFTVGHDERPTEARPKNDTRSSLSLLKTQLAANAWTVKDLGLAEGLAADVPGDASVIMIMGPEKPFLPEEIASIERAIDRGVRLLICLESERTGDPLQEILHSLGLSFDKTPLISAQNYVPISRTDADRAVIYTNRYSSHPSVTTMTRHSTKLATIFARTGSLEEVKVDNSAQKTTITINALEETGRDTNGNFAIDGNEAKRGFALGAAITRTSTGSARETRVFVLADVDVFTDDIVKLSPGNPYLLGDVLYWLRDMKEPTLPVVSAEDVRIVHKRDEDALWFYSSTFGAPAFILVFGLWFGRRRR